MKTIRAIVYDCDGMLVHEERFSHRLEALYDISTDRTQDFFKNSFQLCLVGKADLREELSKLLDIWGWKGSVDELLSFWLSPEHNTVDERFRTIVAEQRARGLKAYMATNNEKYRSKNLIEDTKLGEWFDGTFSSSSLGVKKPDSEFYNLIADAITVSKDEVIFWDDDAGHVEAAKAEGYIAELYSDLDSFKARMRALS